MSWGLKAGTNVCNGDQPSTSKLYHGEWDFRHWIEHGTFLRTGKNFHDVGKLFPAGTHHKRTSN